MSLNISSRRVLAKGKTLCAFGLRYVHRSNPLTLSFLLGLRPTTTCTAAATTHSALVLRPRTQSQKPINTSRPIHTTAPNAISWRGLFGGKKKPASSNTADAAAGLSGDLSQAKTRQELRERMTTPDLGASPLLASEMEQQRQQQGGQDGADGKKPAASSAARNELGTSLLQTDLQRALDPDPRSRVRWERKMVVRHVSRLLDPKGQETREERLARTERQLLHKSMPIPTSTKKLVHLARQISGKTLEDALVQMRFSKKKMAKEVMWHLEEARDMAVVERGMGLGRVLQQKQHQEDGSESAASSPSAIKIQTKDGKWLEITDPSRIYIDQAWVGKGIFRSVQPEYRARGRINRRWSPSSCKFFLPPFSYIDLCPLPMANT